MFRARTCATLLLLLGLHQDGAVPKLAFTRPQSVVASSATLFRMLRPEETSIRPQRWRGGADVFQQVAPAVVVVRTDTGHGTGFIVDSNGLVVTNHHVIATGLKQDAARQASFAMVHLGRIGSDGAMHLLPDPVRAYLYKVDPTRDLALLRIAAPVPGLSSLPHLSLSDAPPRPGQDCAIIGHPSSGMLWTMRPGQVAAIGNMPADLVNIVMLKLASTAKERDAVAEEIRQLPSRKIILTSAQANPGDSGGPVVDEHGRVIAVTFGGPGREGESKFTYHVHLDELKAVLADVPRQPMLYTPDPWALGPRVELKDLDGDGKPDLLLAGSDSPDTLLFDVDEDSPSSLQVSRLVADRKWDFEVGLTTAEGATAAFYDTDNDGTVDLILSGPVQDGNVDSRFVRLPSGGWRYETGLKLPLLSGIYLKDPKLAARADRLIALLAKQ